MIISIVLLLIIANLLNRTPNNKRRILTIITLIIYAGISLCDMIWLFQIEEIPLHPSDPSNYFNFVISSSFDKIIEEKSNIFYPIINWILTRVWIDPYWFCVWIKLDNCLLAVLIYLLLTYKNPKVNHIDFLILFNPYMILTLNRNVRDLYIILFSLIIIIGLGAIKNRKIPKSILFIAIILLGFTRPILLGPLAVSWFILKWNQLNSMKKTLCSILMIGIGILGFEIIIFESMNQMISAMDYSGQDYESLLPLVRGDYSVSAITAFLKTIIPAFAVFILTPNPINFWNDWISNMSVTGASNIYTGFDNGLILLGSIYYYIFIIPYLIYCFFHINKFNKAIICFSILFAILYTISFLGQTDIRNHNTFIFFFLVSIMYSSSPIKLKLRHYITSGLLCLGITKK